MLLISSGNLLPQGPGALAATVARACGRRNTLSIDMIAIVGIATEECLRNTARFLLSLLDASAGCTDEAEKSPRTEYSAISASNKYH